MLTRGKERGNRVAIKLELGTVEINNASHWLHCNPVGGYKESGVGREYGEYGLHELCQIKVVSMEK